TGCWALLCDYRLSRFATETSPPFSVAVAAPPTPPLEAPPLLFLGVSGCARGSGTGLGRVPRLGPLEHEDRDDPLRLLRVVVVRRPGRDGARPPAPPLLAVHLAGDVVVALPAVLQLDERVGDEVPVPLRVVRRPAAGGDDG